jgi:hypothetical protein
MAEVSNELIPDPDDAPEPPLETAAYLARN